MTKPVINRDINPNFYQQILFFLGLGKKKSLPKPILETANSSNPVKPSKVIAETTDSSGFNQNTLQQILFYLGGKELMNVAANITQTSSHQIKLVNHSLDEFGQIQTNIESINQYLNTLFHSIEHLASESSVCEHQLNAVFDKVNVLDQQFSLVNHLSRQIHNISEKTHLLALNAKIEAALAGEKGNGFAVIANEVKNLSQITQSANTQIEHTLTKMTESLQQLTQEVNLALNKMSLSLNVVAQAKETISDVHQHTNQFNRTVSTAIDHFKVLDKTSQDVAVQMAELLTIGDTFKYLVELLKMQNIIDSSCDPLERLAPLVQESNFEANGRFSRHEQEYILQANDIVISSTDTKGIITFANDTFYRIAEYPMGSLVGKPHNIIRHRDMPKTAFADLWNVIKNGKLWQGYVCNVGCTGRIYWVKATVFPCYQHGKITGYLSIREKPLPDMIAKAKIAYRKLQ